jgi:hypothetical protein
MLQKVSILIPCYNAERWITQAIDSALNQTYAHTEVVVVDDGSSDRSLELIKRFGDRIRWETQPNQGGNITRNRLLELSTGEWLQYLDSDDYLLPDKIAQQVEHLAQVQDADLIYSPSLFEHCSLETSRQEVLPIPEPHDPWVLLARWYLPQTGSPLWRKQAILDVGGWKASQPCCQEHELYLRLLKAEKQFVYFSKAGSVYRQWSETTVCKKDKSETIRRRLEILDWAEQHLDQNQARFECARTIWLTNPVWANQIMDQIRAAAQTFVPTGTAAPGSYRLTYRMLGFQAAETIAKVKRELQKSS